MRKVFATSFVMALVVVGLLVPVGSAQAAWRTDPWCENAVLQPGKACVSWPLSINRITISWCSGTPPYNCGRRGDGSVLVGLTQFGGSQHGQPVQGVPGWAVWPSSFGDGIVVWRIDRYNPYMAESHRYGQARIVNLSTVPIDIWSGSESYNVIRHWLP
jgi:hypothetical protein